MTNITQQILADAVATVDDPVFDSHAIIRALMTHWPRQYADDLGATPGNDPILSLHSQIGTALGGLASIIKTRRTTSLNVRGEVTENQEWRKL